MNRILFTLAFLLIPPLVEAQTTINAASCSNAAFSTAISAASSGDTVLGPGGTNTGGGSQLDIPSTKGLIINGGGCSINWGFRLDPHATTSTRITNFTFTANGTGLNPGAAIHVIGPASAELTRARWRIDHNTFTGSGSVIVAMEMAPGLFDHNTMSGGTAADEQIHVLGWGATVHTGWTTAMPSTGTTRAQGTDEAVFFEDNTFTAVDSGNNAWIQAYAGARLVLRYNTFNHFKVDFHGTAGEVGTRWWEVYKNDYHSNGGASGGSHPNVRAGSGIIFSNTTSGSVSPMPGIGLCEEDSGYPADDQIGRGTGSSGSQASDPAYTFLNTQTVAVNTCEAPAQSGMVAFNRDVYDDTQSASCTGGGTCTTGVGSGTTLPTTCTTGVAFWKTDAGGNWDTTHGGANDGALYKCSSTDTWTLYYTPYTYPHPLQGGASTPAPGRPLSFWFVMLISFQALLVIALSGIASFAKIPDSRIKDTKVWA